MKDNKIIYLWLTIPLILIAVLLVCVFKRNAITIISAIGIGAWIIKGIMVSIRLIKEIKNNSEE